MSPTEEAGLSITYDCGRTGPPDLRLLHYNDVYHVEAGSAEPIGGTPRFQTLINYYRNHPRFANLPPLLTFFSGDAFNPSLESSVTKGRHMVPFLNQAGTDVACIGNHDLDFGVEQFRHLRNQCKFPWLLANVLDPALGDGVSLANCLKTCMLESNGVKVGVIGLGEREWLDTVNALPPNIIYKSASETAKELVPSLRAQGARLIVAVTHQREPNDNKLATRTPPGLIDIILGGHDHFYGHSLINSTHVLRSGTDFKQLSYIEAWRKTDDSGWDFSITRRDVVRAIPEDPATVELVDKLTSALKAKLQKPVGYTANPLDARFSTVRRKESNLGNFYFLSLKVLGKWNRLGPSMHRHWDSVNERWHGPGWLEATSPLASPEKQPEERISNPTISGSASPPKFSSFQYNPRPKQQPGKTQDQVSRRDQPDDIGRDSISEDESTMDSESDSEPEVLSRPCTYVTTAALSVEDADHREIVARQFVRKWQRKAGLSPDKIQLVDRVTDGCSPAWTRAIAPVVEGRIVQTTVQHFIVSVDRYSSKQFNYQLPDSWNIAVVYGKPSPRLKKNMKDNNHQK
ncbi:5'-nucleotidase [Histoplasma capsulatum H143]|uniref:5'-nucleotidase n=1 Tax=Ajellomyces capsulatus (strain H143) TaxID=544712 RepID=C6H7N9_AJECH|nr:5'-nucleotidase [Histoplasma capsulatum H143]